MANWSWPVSGSITQGFSATHPGVDIGVPNGTSVLASAPGKIIKAGWWGTGGNTIQIDHGNGTISQYMHLSKFTQTVGSQVAAGQQIGLSGSSGIVTGPHLHFEVNQNGKAIDPMPLLTGAAGASMSALPAGDTAGIVGAPSPAKHWWDINPNDWIINKVANSSAGKAVASTVSLGEATAKGAAFLTDSNNWKRIALGTLGAVILLIAALELTTQSGAVKTIAKVAA